MAEMIVSVILIALIPAILVPALMIGLAYFGLFPPLHFGRYVIGKERPPHDRR